MRPESDDFTSLYDGYASAICCFTYGGFRRSAYEAKAIGKEFLDRDTRSSAVSVFDVGVRLQLDGILFS